MLNERIGDGGEHLRPLGKGDAPDGTPVIVRKEHLPGLAIPEADAGVGACRQDPAREAVNVQVPDGSLVPFEGPDSVPVLGAPHGRDVILAGGEEQVSIIVVLYECDGPLVALQQDWPLFGGGRRGGEWGEVSN